MQLNEIVAGAEDHERGRWAELADPVTGKGTGIRLRLAGPDSATARKARLRMADDLVESADLAGRVMAEARETARLDMLARLVLGWEVQEDGQPVPFNHANVLRLLRAASWVEEQVDLMAADRAAFRGTT